MSAAWSRYIRENFRAWTLSSTAAHLLDTIACYANAEGFAWPSSAELAARMRVHIRTVERARAELRDAGVIAVLSGDGRGHATVYGLPSAAVKADTHVDLSTRERPTPMSQRPTPMSVKADTHVGPRSNRRSNEGARVDWCDETCPSCAGAGWISELRIVKGQEGWWADRCPNRVS